MRRAVRHQGMIVQLHDAIHTNRATVKENRKNYSYPSVGLSLTLSAGCYGKCFGNLKQMHAEVVYQAVLAGQLLLPLRLVRPMIVSLLKGTINTPKK
jgi:hypothetical protein